MSLSSPSQTVARKTGLEWFYRLLDVEYGISIAVEDAQRCKNWQAALFSTVINGILLVIFGLLWIRYDLWSTATVFLPVADSIMQVVPQEGTWATWRWIIGLIVGVGSAFATSLIQWGYARLAARHDAMLWGFAAACLFDIATDYIDVGEDFPGWFGGLITAAQAVTPGWWALGILVFIFASFIWSGGRSLYWILAVACAACLAIEPGTVMRWIIIFIGTIFCSFAVQSLVLIHVAKVITLVFMGQQMRAASRVREVY